MDTFLEISLIIGIATAVAFVMQKLRQPLILGHILTGIIVGPIGFHIIQSGETIETFSKLGIVTLLFIIGLGLSPKITREVGRVSLIAGIGQVLFTAGIGYGIGLLLHFSPITSLYLAIAFTFSSTIIISKLLADKRDTNKLYGKIAIGMLLVQDVLATLALIIITSLMNGGGAKDLLIVLIAKGFIAVGGAYIAATIILPYITKTFAKSQDFLFLFSIAWCIGIASLFDIFGLSLELGALAAGITLATSSYHYEIEAKTKLLRDFFIVMFFILLGSKLTAGNLVQFIWPTTIYSLFILIGNPIIVMIIMGAMKYSKKTGFLTGLTVAQISEFSIILVMLGVQAKHLDASYLSLATMVGIITIAGSTVMILHADKLYQFLSPILHIFERKNSIGESNSQERFDIVLFGCHRVGSDFLPSIIKRRRPYLVIDFDPQTVDQLHQHGINARYGDAEDDALLDSIQLDKTKLVVSTIPDFETNTFLLEKIRKINTKAIIILIAQHIYEANELYRDGASYVVMPHHMGGNYAAMLIARHGSDPKQFKIEKEKHLKHLQERHVFLQK